MKEKDLTSFAKEDTLEIKKSFSKYILDIEFEIQKYGIHVAQSEILAFILEKIAGKKTGNASNPSIQSLTKKEINANAEEISLYIINRKFPFVEKFNRSDEDLNKFQLAVKRSRLSNLSELSSLRLLQFSNFMNLVFVIISIFLGIQSILVLSLIFTSNEGKDQTFLDLDGNLIYGYSSLWKPSTIVLMGIFYIFNLILSYLVLNLPTLSRLLPNLNDHYNSLVLKIKLNFIMAISFISFMLLGSLFRHVGEPINGYEPIGDLGITFLVTVISTVFGVYMLIILRKERFINLDYSKPKLVTQLIFYLTNFLGIILSLVLFIYLALIARDDYNEMDGLALNSFSIPLDLEVLNFISIVIFPFFLSIFVISSLSNHSRLKNKWHKFMLIQIMFQSLIVLLYSALQYYFIIKYNDFSKSVGSTRHIPVWDLWQGVIKYYGSAIVSYVFLKISK